MMCRNIWKTPTKRINEDSQIFKAFGRRLEDNHSITLKGGESWEYGYDILLKKFKDILENL
jgi:hypothetical protein